MNTDRNWNIGQTILNLYKVIDVLGEGGFGKVVRVLHQDWNKELAVKIPRQETIEALGGVKNFEQEAQTWVDMQLHPHTVSCYYVRNIENKPTVFAEYIEGGSLYDWIYGKNGQPPKLYNPKLYDVADSPQLSDQPVHEIILERIIDIAIQFAWGLDYAHEKGLVHKDVKPSNVMLMPKGTVKVTDFGLTQSTAQIGVGNRDNLDSSAIVTGVAGTPAYFSPEQVKKAELDLRSDLFSWGLSVLEMLKGERRWKYGNWVSGHDLEYYVQSEARLPSYLKQLSTSDTAQKLFNLLRDCCQENPNHRPENMMVVADRLEAIYKDIAGKKYLRKKPKLADLIADDCNNRALSNLELGKSGKAISLWQEALKAQPEHPEATYNYGLFRWRKVKLDSYRETLTCIFAHLTEAKLCKFALLVIQNCPESINDDELVENLEGVISSNSDNWIPKYLLAQVHLERDDCEAAIMILESINEEDLAQYKVRELLDIAEKREPESTRFLQTFEGHQSWVESVCFSNDGTFALSASDDCTIKKWDLKTDTKNKCLHTFRGHTGKVSSICLSKDDQIIISTGFDKTIKKWNANGELLRDNFVDNLQDTSNITPYLYLLDLDDNKLYYRTKFVIILLKKIIPSILVNLMFLVVQSIFVSGTSTGVKTWYSFQEKDGNFWSLNISEDDKLLVSGSLRLFLSGLKIWDVNLETSIKILERKKTNFDQDEVNRIIMSVCLSKDKKLVLYSRNGLRKNLGVWDVENNRLLRFLEGHRYNVNSACLSQDDDFALSGSDDDTLKWWDINNGVCLRTFIGHQDHVNSVCLSKNNKFALSGSRDGTLKLWDIETGRCLRTLSGHIDINHSIYTKEILSTALNKDNTLALSGSRDKTLKLWQINYSSHTYSAPFILSQIQKTETVLKDEELFKTYLSQAKQALNKRDYIDAIQQIKLARKLVGYEKNKDAQKLWESLYCRLPRKNLQNVWLINSLQLEQLESSWFIRLKDSRSSYSSEGSTLIDISVDDSSILV
ncbi:serine/threonine-protein kinase, partial [Moorena sp. SIO4G3]|uniref:serine/threonine-protein kinase n=1 Tax=Moorena sp. SIO4G3 TaxID=2607821 RepID=UPI00142CB5C3